jgi:hypothetical protein
MPEVVVFKGDDGKLVGHGDRGERAYARFQARLRELERGATLAFSWREPRAPATHRFFFAFLRELFSRQEAFQDEDEMRAWLTVGAGYVRFVQGRDALIALPQSIAFDKLDEDEFRELIHKVKQFLWDPHAYLFLWPHLSPQKAYEMVDQLHLEFDR